MKYKVISMIMNLAPFGVFALLLPVIAEDGSKLLMPLASVIACVAIASVVHVTGVYSVMARIWGKVAGIDRILDMFRTWVNNTGNSAVAAVVDRTVK